MNMYYTIYSVYSSNIAHDSCQSKQGVFINVKYTETHAAFLFM